MYSGRQEAQLANTHLNPVQKKVKAKLHNIKMITQKEQ